MKAKGLISLSLALSVTLFPSIAGADSHTHTHSHQEAVDSQGNEVEISDVLPKAEIERKQTFDVPALVEEASNADILNENGVKIGEKVIEKTKGNLLDQLLGQNDSKETQKNREAGLCLFGCSGGGDDGSGSGGGDDTSGDRTATVLIAADEEYRAARSDWQTFTQNIVENADNAFVRDHGIDLEVQAFAQWSSEGNNASEILQDLDQDWNGQGYDFVVGFTKDSNFNAGGIAYVYQSSPYGSAVSVNLDQGAENTWRAAQHEFSHNYGLGHDAQGSGIECIMNYDYSYEVDYWDQEHDDEIQAHKAWYGN
ncbi:zinc-dependent metalloprotease [Halobacillus yeomjeoni]|uniref:zinc-dependent metalloprotease n=1 Tax=Halobacillus yeomjeoni TaxID=311194 RepID=UPI001CD1B18F|nr:zinc-dependent metalloprotease [Halobacillus yeomjeoni]MCA0983397.1 zinc-dependent metalloprotease [Halobacillus yeomjeoni]